MPLLRFVVVLVLFALTFSQVTKLSCGWIGNNYIRIRPGTVSNGQISYYTISSGLCSKRGWSALAFSQNGTISNSSLTVMMWLNPENTNGTQPMILVKMNEHGNMSSTQDKTTAWNSQLLTSVLTMYEIFETEFTVPSSEFNFGNVSYVHFACADGIVPPSRVGQGWSVTQHTTVLGASISTMMALRGSCDLVLNVLPRLADISLPVFFIEFFIYLFCVPLWFFLRDFEPLRSRSIVPLATVFFLYGITMSSSLLHLMTLAQNAVYQCKLYGLILMPASLILGTLMFLNYLRYILIVNINKNKEYLHEGRDPFSFKVIRILKSMSSISVMSWIVIGMYFVCAILYICIGAIWQYDCTSIQYVVISIPLYMSLIPLFLVFGVGIYDTFLNRKTIFRCELKNFFWKNDPLLFRFEQLLGVISILSAIPVLVFVSVLAPINALRDRQNLASLKDFVYYIEAALTSWVFYSIFIYLYLFPVTVTIFIQLKAWICRRNKVKLDEIEKIFLDPGLTVLFADFSKSEWSLENVLIYQDIMAYKKKPSLENAWLIYYRFLDGINSDMEVNVPFGACVDLKNRIDENTIDSQSFDIILNHIKLNLADTYSRFVFSTEYITWLKNDTFAKQNLIVTESMYKPK